MATFHRGALARRASGKASEHVLSRWYVPVITSSASAVGAAVEAAHKGQPETWTHVLVVGLVAGLGIYLALSLVVFAYHLLRHALTGGSDREWQATHEVTQDSLSVSLICKLSPPSSLHAREPIKCEVKTPSGRLITIPDQDLRPRYGGAWGWACFGETLEIGTYRARWFGSTERRRFYEITRETFEIGESQSLHSSSSGST